MTKELVLANVTEVVVNSTDELPALQQPLPIWARKKLEAARAEAVELSEAADTAKRCKWNPAPLRKAANKALERVTFYEKVVMALEAGYMLFPPVPNADVIAIRTTLESPGDARIEDRGDCSWDTPMGKEERAEILPAGEGDYKNPLIRWRTSHKYERTKSDGSKERRRQWSPLQLEDPEFPLLMGKPEIIEAVNAAQELKVFDEIRMFPFERVRRGDPCILGSIINGDKQNRLYFLISWRINESDL